MGFLGGDDGACGVNRGWFGVKQVATIDDVAATLLPCGAERSICSVCVLVLCRLTRLTAVGVNADSAVSGFCSQAHVIVFSLFHGVATAVWRVAHQG